MKLSYVIITHNRRDTLLRTLARLHSQTVLTDGTWDVWMVDNASTDGTADMVSQAFASVNVIRLAANEGMPARNHAIERAAGEYLAIIDDDSYPLDDAVPRVLRYMDAHPGVAAVSGRALLPDGSAEASAFLAIMIGCATILRASAVREVRAFDPQFFRQAEEYDLSFKLWRAGYRVERFEDVLFRHDKAPGGRSSSLVAKLDLRNNLILADAFLPPPLRNAYWEDWALRYAALAQHAGHAAAADEGLHEAIEWALHRAEETRPILNADACENIFELERQRDATIAWAAKYGVRRITIADFGKNIFATWLACRAAGLEVTAVADDSPAFAGLAYRGLPILPYADAFAAGGVDGVLLSNINPAQVERRAAQVRRVFQGPFLRFWQPSYLSDAGAEHSPRRRGGQRFPQGVTTP